MRAGLIRIKGVDVKCTDCGLDMLFPVHRINMGPWIDEPLCIDCYEKRTKKKPPLIKGNVQHRR